MNTVISAVKSECKQHVISIYHCSITDTYFLEHFFKRNGKWRKSCFPAWLPLASFNVKEIADRAALYLIKDIGTNFDNRPSAPF